MNDLAGVAVLVRRVDQDEGQISSTGFSGEDAGLVDFVEIDAECNHWVIPIEVELRLVRRRRLDLFRDFAIARTVSMSVASSMPCSLPAAITVKSGLSATVSEQTKRSRNGG